MFKYILKRLGLLLATFVILFVVTFSLIKVLPVHLPLNPTEREMALIFHEKMGYNKPILEQLWIYLRNIFVEGSWGYSMTIAPYTPAWQMILPRLPASIVTGLGAIIIGIPIGISLGYFAARKKNKWQDHVISTGVIIFISLPSFLFGFMVLYFLCFKLGWWGIQVPLLSDLNTSTWFSLRAVWAVMPAIITLSFGTIAGWTRAVRAELTEAMTSDYILLARTKGLTKGQSIRRHAMKNAMVPLFPGILAAIVGILSGAMITEQLFGIPGIGPLYLQALNNLDYDIFMLISMFFLLISLLMGIVLDLSRSFLDPRIRVGSKKGGNY